MKVSEDVHANFARREFLRLAALAGVSAAMMPRLAFAASDPEAFPKVIEVIQRWVGPGKFPGLLAFIGLPGREPRYVLRGTEGFTDHDPLTGDSLYRIYSMTKPITAMAGMMLIEDGKMRLDQPIADFLPRFAKMQVQVTPDGPLADVRSAKTQITVRQLMTHTAGLGYAIIQQGPMRAAMMERGLGAGRVGRIRVPGFDDGNAAPSLKVFADRLAELPLVYEPGTTWSYSVGLDLLGRVIEVASGKGFEAFLRERMFDPLDMRSTWFQVPRSAAKRLTTNFTVVNGVFVPIDKGEESVYLDPPAMPFGGSGLVSSPRDYDRFLHMLANRGTLGGKRVLREETVRLATSNLLPSGMTTPAAMGPVSHFGAGGRVGIGVEEGIYGWAGAAGTTGTVDLKRGVRMGAFAQFMPPNSLPMLAELNAAMRADVAALSRVPA